MSLNNRHIECDIISILISLIVTPYLHIAEAVGAGLNHMGFVTCNEGEGLHNLLLEYRDGTRLPSSKEGEQERGDFH